MAFGTWANCCLSFTWQHPNILLLLLLSFISLSFFYLMGSTKWRWLGLLIIHKKQLHHLITTLLLEHDSLTFDFGVGTWFPFPRYLITCYPPNINHILNTNFPNYPNGPDFREIFGLLGDGILTSDGDSWASQRKTATVHLSTRGFRSLMMTALQDKTTGALLPLLERAAGSEQFVDLSDLFMRLMTDAACAAFLGVDPGYLSPELPDFPFADAVELAEHVTLGRHLVPKQWWKLLRWLRVGREGKLAEAWVPAERFIRQCIQAKRNELEEELKKSGGGENKSGSSDLLTLYMEDLLVDRDRGVLLDDPDKVKFIRDTILTMVIAGNDSSAIALAWFFFLVIENPAVEKKIVQELTQIRRPSTSRNDYMFEEKETEGAVYLQAALLETLRLYPPIPFSHKQALEGDTLPSGHRVEAGTNIVFPSYSMARMEAIWGKDCSEFKPERWMHMVSGSGGGRLEVRHEPSYKFMAFLSGPRACMGKIMALSRLKWAIAAVLYNFEFELVEGHAVKPKLAMMLRMKNGLMVKVRKRVFD